MFLTSVSHKFEFGVIDAARKDVQNEKKKILNTGIHIFIFFLLMTKMDFLVVFSYLCITRDEREQIFYWTIGITLFEI
jgi:hypothetical protein